MVNLKEKLEKKTAKIGIVGLGYVGLPLAVAFAEAGFKVLGFDIQQKRVDAINQGKSYIADISSKSLQKIIKQHRFTATTEQSRRAEPDIISICVPTPLTRTKEPDLTYVVKESKSLCKTLRPGQLIILESTTYPGTTREVILPILETTGLKVGKDFYLAFSPERIDPGSPGHTLQNTPKVVGGLDKATTKLAALYYSQITDRVVEVSSPESAEMVKVFENVFRSVNIALVNELAQLCPEMNISVWEVIKAASTKPFGYMPFYPGPGVGGHCIPLDPYYLASKAREFDFHTRFIELAGEVNERMPYYVTSRIVEGLNNVGKSIKGAKIIVLGVAYKKDIDDVRESPSLKLIELLESKKADVSYNDPYKSEITINGCKYESVELTQKNLASADCVVIATDHTCYDLDTIIKRSRLVFDSRGVTVGRKEKNILRLGE